MKQDFDLIQELKNNKWPLAGMCLLVFVLTLLLFSGGGSNQDPAGEKPDDRLNTAQIDLGSAGKNVLLDFSERVFEADQFTLTGPVRFFTRRAGTNQIQFERKPYELDEARLDPRSVPGTGPGVSRKNIINQSTVTNVAGNRRPQKIGDKK